MAKPIVVKNNTVTLTKEQFEALQKAASGAPAAKPKRSLTFKRYVDGVEQKSDAQTFAAAIAAGDGSVYAHASCSTRAVSAAAVSEILTALGYTLT